MYCLLFLLWLALNGKITLEILLLGLVVTAGLGVLCKILFSYTPKTELRVLKTVPIAVAYAGMLLLAVIRSNLVVLSLILRGKKALNSTLVTFRVDLKTEFARYILANSITLTPGTITVKADEDRFTVHCLRPALLDNIENSVFVRLLRKMEG